MTPMMLVIGLGLEATARLIRLPIGFRVNEIFCNYACRRAGIGPRVGGSELARTLACRSDNNLSLPLRLFAAGEVGDSLPYRRIIG